MKSLLFVTTSISYTLACTVTHAANDVKWFESITPLTQTHQHLLNNELENMFNSLTKVWQLEKSNKSQLNNLLLQSLTVGCGKSLSKKALPAWIKSINVRKQEIQSPGRETYQIIVTTETTVPLNAIELQKWDDTNVTLDSVLLSTSDGVTKLFRYTKTYTINNRIMFGLYRLNILPVEGQESWRSWVILEEEKMKQLVRWSSKDQWKVEKLALLNPYCPLPRLKVSVHQYIDEQAVEIWHKSYESHYPNSLEVTNLPPERYILSISMNHYRWQGPIVIEHSQIVSKSYDVASDEELDSK